MSDGEEKRRERVDGEKEIERECVMGRRRLRLRERIVFTSK